MKFVKGMVIGAVGAAGIAMMYIESNSKVKRHLMKKGKQLAKRMGIM